MFLSTSTTITSKYIQKINNYLRMQITFVSLCFIQLLFFCKFFMMPVFETCLSWIKKKNSHRVFHHETGIS